MLLLLPIIFSVTTVYRTSRISAPGFQAVNFAQAKERRKLNGSVIKQVDVRSEDECSLQCVRNERCLSYNFENTRNESGTFACELSNSDRFSGFGNFTEHDNFTYRGIQVKIPIFDDFFFNQPCQFLSTRKIYMTPMSTTITIYHAKERKAITCIQTIIIIHVLNHHSAGLEWKPDTTIDVPREQ